MTVASTRKTPDSASIQRPAEQGGKRHHTTGRVTRTSPASAAASESHHCTARLLKQKSNWIIRKRQLFGYPLQHNVGRPLLLPGVCQHVRGEIKRRHTAAIRFFPLFTENPVLQPASSPCSSGNNIRKRPVVRRRRWYPVFAEGALRCHSVRRHVRKPRQQRLYHRGGSDGRMHPAPVSCAWISSR